MNNVVKKNDTRMDMKPKEVRSSLLNFGDPSLAISRIMKPRPERSQKLFSIVIKRKDFTYFRQ